MRACVFGAAVLGLLGAATAAAQTAPPADKPVLKPDAVLEIKGKFNTVKCARWEVTTLDKDGYAILRCGENLAYLSVAHDYALVKITGAGGERLLEFKPYSPVLSFPLTPGRKWQAKYAGYTADDGYSWTSEVSCEAKEVETLRLAAGELPAHRVDCTDNWSVGAFSGQDHTKTWYSVEVGGVIKNVNAEHDKWDFELTGYAPK